MEKIKNFETLTSEQIVERLKTDRKHGLSEEEAAKRLEANGKNKLAEKAKDPWYKIFFSQFNDAMIFVLFAAILVTAGISIYDTVKCIRAGEAFNFFARFGVERSVAPEERFERFAFDDCRPYENHKLRPLQIVAVGLEKIPQKRNVRKQPDFARGVV